MRASVGSEHLPIDPSGHVFDTKRPPIRQLVMVHLDQFGSVHLTMGWGELRQLRAVLENLEADHQVELDRVHRIALIDAGYLADPGFDEDQGDGVGADWPDEA